MKRYLADTDALLWFVGGESRRLGKKAKRAFDGLRTGRAEIRISTLSLWEVALLHDEGKVLLSQGFETWCDGLESLRGMAVEPVLRGDIDHARSLRDLGDPMDRLIAGTALRLGVPLITADARVHAHGRVPTVW